MNTYYRFQPTGKDLLAWTSQGSEVENAAGCVFAYRSPDETIAGFHAWGLPDFLAEVIEFTGDEASQYDPGDYEGVAIRPIAEIRRLELGEWLAEHGADDLAAAWDAKQLYCE